MFLFGRRRRRAHIQQDPLELFPSPGETSSRQHLKNVEQYAKSLRPQARETAQRLARPRTTRRREVASGSTVYEEVVYRIAADNNWQTSVKSVANQIVDQAARRYPNNETQKARFAAYLSRCAAEALVFMLPSSGDDAAVQLHMMVETLRPHDDSWCSVKEASILLGRDGVCPACGVATDA